MTSAPVVVEHLTKSFGRSRGVTDVSFTVPAGEILGFLGPNGAGKTTTIRCLLGLYRPTSGGARVLGCDPTTADPSYRADIGYLPGELHLPDVLTGGDILARFARLRGLRDTASRQELVERLGVEVDRPLRTLSKGNRQKLGLVLALMHRPRLLVLDEPTSGLDPLLQEEFATLLREATARGSTVLLSSHDLDEVQRIAGRVVIIREGRIVVDDTVERLRAGAPRTVELTFDRPPGTAPVHVRTLARVPGVTIVRATEHRLTLSHTGPAGPLLRALAALDPDGITARPADLEELFLRLYGGEGRGPDHEAASASDHPRLPQKGVSHAR